MNNFKIIKFRISESLYKLMNENIDKHNNNQFPFDYLNISKYIRKLIYEDYEKLYGMDTNFCSNELQERIDKAIEYINNLKIFYEHNDNICSTEDKFKNDLLKILKGDSYV